MRKKIAILSTLILTLSSQGFSDTNFKLGDVGIDINGFVSTGASISSSSVDYSIPKHGKVNNNIDFSTPSLIGLQMKANPGNGFSALGQFVANGDDANGNSPYTLTTPWLYMNYQYNSHVSFNLGRMQIPGFMYSQTIDVGYSYPYAYLPNAVYRILPFSSFNDAMANFKTSLGHNWTAQVSPFYGESNFQYDAMTIANNNKLTPIQAKAANITGVVADISNPFLDFRGSFLPLS